VKKCAWPPGSKTFTIHPKSGKKRGEGNGVGPIKLEFIKELRKRGWTIEGAAKNHLGQDLGDFDAVLLETHPESLPGNCALQFRLAERQN
jgi:hypothetical protein